MKHYGLADGTKPKYKGVLIIFFKSIELGNIILSFDIKHETKPLLESLVFLVR